jgi:predicted RNA-binding protein (virulence factor B family)
MLNLGQVNKLTAARPTDHGIYLVDEDSNEVLLPNKYVEETLIPGNEIEVFLYKDSKERIVATTIIPEVTLHGYAALEALTVTDIGAFFDWGLEKDLFVPYSQQAEQIEEGEFYVVYLYLDEKTERLVGSTKINNTLNRTEVTVKVGDEVKLMPYEETEIGISVIVNNMYQGMLFKNEIFEKINVGDDLTGYVKKVRTETDNKIDVSLNSFGYSGVDANIKKLYKALEEHNGYLNLNDKSSPEDIHNQLGMSKKVFKKAVGALYKQKRIKLLEKGIELIEKKEAPKPEKPFDLSNRTDGSEN